VGRDEFDRLVIRREWRNTGGQLHRTTGPAMEEWTVLPGGAHVLSYQVWYVNGRQHRVGRPAVRIWQVANDGARALVHEEWWRHGGWHRVGGPSWRRWTIDLDGTRTLARENWWADGGHHHVDGPAYQACRFYWHGAAVTQDALPWLRRGRDLLNALAEATGRPHGAPEEGSPAWSRDARVAMTEAHGGSNPPPTPATYRSTVGGSALPWLRRGWDLLNALAEATLAWSRDARVAMTEAHGESSPPTPTTYRSAVGGSVLLCV